VAARYKAYVSYRALVGSNPARRMNVCLLYGALSGRGLCNGQIPGPEESY
jgi:hypothetical protein